MLDFMLMFKDDSMRSTVEVKEVVLLSCISVDGLGLYILSWRQMLQLHVDVTIIAVSLAFEPMMV